jgi:hypothetical protein
MNQLGGTMSLHVVVRVASVLLGIIGAACLAAATTLLLMWVLDGSGFNGSRLLAVWGAVTAAWGAAFLWLARVLPRLAERARAGAGRAA